MASDTHHNHSRFKPSIIDRLLDADPGNGIESFHDQGLTWNGYLNGLRRDLQDLLNTRRHFREQAPDSYGDANNSILTYGLPELEMSKTTGTLVRDRLCSVIELSIRTFEPRLVEVRVISLPTSRETGELHFRIEAYVRVTPFPERVYFDTRLDTDRQTYTIEDLR